MHHPVHRALQIQYASGAWDADRAGNCPGAPLGYCPGVRCLIASGRSRRPSIEDRFAALDACAGCSRWRVGGGATIGALYTGRGPVCGITTRAERPSGVLVQRDCGILCCGSLCLCGSYWCYHIFLRSSWAISAGCGDCGSATGGTAGVAASAFQWTGGVAAGAAGVTALGAEGSAAGGRRLRCSRRCCSCRREHDRRLHNHCPAGAQLPQQARASPCAGGSFGDYGATGRLRGDGWRCRRDNDRRRLRGWGTIFRGSGRGGTTGGAARTTGGAACLLDRGAASGSFNRRHGSGAPRLPLPVSWPEWPSSRRRA